MISFLDENRINFDRYQDKNIIESIKCHHNDFTKYFLEKRFRKKKFFLEEYLQYNNYEDIPVDLDIYSKPRLNYEDVFNCIQKNPEFIELLFNVSYLNINLVCNLYFVGGGPRKSLLIYAIEKENVEIIKLLLSYSQIDPNIVAILIDIIFMMVFIIISYKTALIVAIEKNNIEIINLLLSCQKIDLNIQII